MFQIEIDALTVVVLEELAAAGYLWDLTTLDREIVNLVADEPSRYVSHKPVAIGGPVKRILVLRGLRPGKTMINMVRPWAPGDVAATATFVCEGTDA